MAVKDIKAKIEYYNKLLEIITKEPESFIEMVFLKYVETGRTADVAALLNQEGYRIKGLRKVRLYISTDITHILDDPDNQKLIDPKVYRLVKKMQLARRTTQKHVLEIMGGDEDSK